MNEIPALKVDLDGGGFLALEAVAEGSLSLQLKRVRQRGAHWPVVLVGTCKNLPDGTPCDVAPWVMRSKVASKEHEELRLEKKPKLQVYQGKCQLEFKVPVVAWQLFHSGTLGFRVTPEYPGMNAAPIQPSIKFDHHLKAYRIKPSGEALQKVRIGEGVRLGVDAAPIFKSCRLLVRIEEYEGAGMKHKAGLSQDLEARWRRKVDWPAGYDGATHKRLVYQDHKEKGGLEFMYSLRVADRGSETSYPATKPAKLVACDWPVLEQFELERRGVVGQIAGVTSGYPLELEVWGIKTFERGKVRGKLIKSMGKLRVKTGGDGVFRAKKGPAGGWYPAFALLRFPKHAAGTGKAYEVVSRLLVYRKPFLPCGDTAATTKKHVATAVASKERRTIASSLRQPALGRITFKEHRGKLRIRVALEGGNAGYWRAAKPKIAVEGKKVTSLRVTGRYAEGWIALKGMVPFDWIEAQASIGEPGARLRGIVPDPPPPVEDTWTNYKFRL